MGCRQSALPNVVSPLPEQVRRLEAVTERLEVALPNLDAGFLRISRFGVDWFPLLLAVTERLELAVGLLEIDQVIEQAVDRGWMVVG